MKYQGNLLKLIREESLQSVGVMNDLSQLEKYHHNEICKKLISLAEKHSYPITQVVYVAVGKNAHRPNVFENGYKKIDIERFEQVIKLCDVFAKKFGTKWRNNGFLCHTIDRYLTITKHRKELKFRQLVNDCNIDFNTIKYKTAKQFAKDFFGSQAVYNDNGYIIEVNDCM